MAVTDDFTEYDPNHGLRPGMTCYPNALRSHGVPLCLARQGVYQCQRYRGHPGHHIDAPDSRVVFTWFRSRTGLYTLHTSDNADHREGHRAEYERAMRAARREATEDDPAPWADTARQVIIELGTAQGLPTSKINEKLREAGLDPQRDGHDVTVEIVVNIRGSLRGGEGAMLLAQARVRDAFRGLGGAAAESLLSVQATEVKQAR